MDEVQARPGDRPNALAGPATSTGRSPDDPRHHAPGRADGPCEHGHDQDGGPRRPRPGLGLTGVRPAEQGVDAPDRWIRAGGMETWRIKARRGDAVPEMSPAKLHLDPCHRRCPARTLRGHVGSLRPGGGEEDRPAASGADPGRPVVTIHTHRGPPRSGPAR